MNCILLIGPASVFFKNPKNKANLFFLCLDTVAGPLWTSSCVLFLLVENMNAATLCAKFIYISAILISLFLFLFSIHYPRYRKPHKLVSYGVIAVSAFLFYELLFTKNWLQEIIIEGDNYVVLGPVYLVWVALFLMIVLYNIYKISTMFKSLSLIEKQQQIYVIVGLVLTTVGSTPTNVIITYTGIYKYIWVGPIIYSIGNLIVSYGISRTRFLGVNKVFRKIFRFLFIYILPALLSVSLITYVYPILEEKGASVNTLYILTLAWFILLFKIFYVVSEEFFLSDDEILRRKGDDYYRSLSFTNSIEDVCTKTLKYIVNNSSTDSAYVYLYNSLNYKSYNYVVEDWTIDNIKELFNELPSYWNSEEAFAKPLITSDLEYELKNMKDKDLGQLLRSLHSSKVQVAYPIVSDNTLIGVLFIKDKGGNRVFNTGELTLFDKIYGQFHIAINRALLYKQLQSLNGSLQKQVSAKTKELTMRLEELEEARRNERDMIDIMGHELRTPATVIKINAELMSKYISSNPADYKKYLTRVRNGVENEIRLINTLLTSAKLEGNRVELMNTPIDPVEEVDSIVNSYKVMSKEKNIEIINKMSKKSPMIYADKTRFMEILDNLIGNAVKYTEEGSVTIRSSIEGKNFRIYVTDTGIGMPEDEISQLGVKFHRVNNYINNQSDTVVVRPGGTGLGLYVVFGLLKLMNGTIDIKSTLGKGSTFSFTLPIYDKKDKSQITAEGAAVDMFAKLGLKKKSKQK